MARSPAIAHQVAPHAPAPRFDPAGTLLLTGLTTALVALGSGLLAHFVPTWRPGFLVAACLLVAVEAALVRYRMQHGRHIEAGALSYLAAELFVLAVLMRAGATLSLSSADPRADLEAWVGSPLAALDGPFVACFLAGLAVAFTVRAGLRALAELEPPVTPAASAPGLEGEVFRAEAERHEGEAVAQIAGALGWGAILALLAVTAQLADLGGTGRTAALAPSTAAAGVVYMICAVLLYSRARLGLLRARWARDATTVDPGMTPRWHTNALALVLAMALLGLALPGGYGGELLALAQGALIALLNLSGLTAFILGTLAMGLFGMLLTIPAFILAWLTSGGGVFSGPVTPLPPGPRPPPAAPVEPPVAPGVIFWLCVALLALYAIWTVLRRQEWAVALLERVRAGALGRALAWLAALWGRATRYAQALGEAAAERLRPPPQPVARPRRPRRLGPGELVRYFYASVLAAAAGVGLGRRRAETPYEYRERLRADLPDREAEVDQITEAYVAAAYAPRETSPEEARRARGLWVRIKRALRR